MPLLPCWKLSGQAQLDLDRLLTVLSVEESACMLLCYNEGYSHAEASDLLELPDLSIDGNVLLPFIALSLAMLAPALLDRLRS